MEIIFINPGYLWALVGIPVIIFMHFFALRYSKARALKFANFAVLSKVSGGGTSYRITVLTVRTFIFILIVLALAGITVIYIGKSSTVDYMLAIDSSSSMLNEDFKPNRLEAAKEAAGLFIDNIPIGSSAALMSFSGTAFIEQTLTTDKIGLKTKIKNISPQIIGGTDVAGAIISGVNVLLSSTKPRVIVLLTDGRSNVGVSEETAIDYANKNGVIVYTIGVGLKNSDDVGIDENSLIKISENTGGKYSFVENEGQLESIYSGISKNFIGKKFLNLSLIFIVVALILLLVDWTIINIFYSRVP